MHKGEVIQTAPVKMRLMIVAIIDYPRVRE